MKPHFSHTGKVQAIHMTQKYRNISFSKRKRKTSILTQGVRFFRPNLDMCSLVSLCLRVKEKSRTYLTGGSDMRTYLKEGGSMQANPADERDVRANYTGGYMMAGKGFFLQVNSITI